MCATFPAAPPPPTKIPDTTIFVRIALAVTHDVLVRFPLQTHAPQPRSLILELSHSRTHSTGPLQRIRPSAV